MFNRIERPRVLRAILEQIKQSIADGTLKKGDRLPAERQLPEIFGVSRAMIREAIKSLEMIGLVSCVQGGGNFIATNLDNSMTEPLSIMFMLEDGSLSQVQELRRILEIGSVRLAAVRAGHADLAGFEKICGVLENHTEPCDEAEQDRLFHYAIAQAAGNPLFTTMLNAVSALIENQIRGVRRKMLQEADTLDEVNRQHRAILAAIQSGDPGQAEAAMTRHLDFIEKYLAP